MGVEVARDVGFGVVLGSAEVFVEDCFGGFTGVEEALDADLIFL